MTQDPTAPRARTTQLVEHSHADTKGHDSEKLSEVPSKMVALLHKALLEQKHDEADRRQEFEEDQKDLKQQEAVTKKHTTEKEQEDPNMELARYIEEEEKKKKAHESSTAKATAHGRAKSGGATHSAAHTSHSLPGDSSLNSEVGCVALKRPQAMSEIIRSIRQTCPSLVPANDLGARKYSNFIHFRSAAVRVLIGLMLVRLVAAPLAPTDALLCHRPL